MDEIILRDETRSFEMAVRIKEPEPGMELPAYQSMLRNAMQAYINMIIATYPVPDATKFFFQGMGIVMEKTAQYIGDVKGK